MHLLFACFPRLFILSLSCTSYFVLRNFVPPSDGVNKDVHFSTAILDFQYVTLPPPLAAASRFDEIINTAKFQSKSQSRRDKRE